MRGGNGRLSSWALSGLALATVLLGSCSDGGTEAGAEAERIVVAVSEEAAIDPGERLGSSSRVVLVETGRGTRTLSLDGRPAGNATVSWTGRRALLAMQDDDGDGASIWSVSLADGRGEALDLGGLDCGSADELPDGRIVFSARTPEPAPTPELRSSWALWVHDPEAGTTIRITWGLTEIDPGVLADGRIVFAGWQPGGDGRPEGGAFGLFTVHPDGSGVAPFHGHHAPPRWKLRPRELANGDVVFLAGDDPGALRPLRIDRRAPSSPARPFSEAGESELRTVARGAGAHDIGLRLDGRVLELPHGRSLAGVPAGATDAILGIGRPRPQGHLSMIDPEGDRGTVFIVDARPPVEAASPAFLRVRAAAPGGPERELGRVELAGDGSAFLELPANVRLWLDVLDAAEHPLSVSTTPIWVRPGEKRGCVGCHEDPVVAPPNRRPDAVLRDPVDLTGGMS